MIGRLLSCVELPYDYCKPVSEGMFYSWRMNRTGSWEDFYRGVEDGYYSLTQEFTTPPPLLPPQTSIRSTADEEADEEPSILESSDDDGISDEVESDDDMAMNENTSVVDTHCLSPVRPNLVVKTFDEITGQWISQRDESNSSPPRMQSHRETITIDSSDDEVPGAFSITKPQQHSDEPIISQSQDFSDLVDNAAEDLVVLAEDKDDSTYNSRVSVSVQQSAEQDQFATDRERVRMFWG
ncbi:hypothetical protein EYZ11_001605 [Aspergillus tanneri]|nr:hypothetical protein EYZ11_001605 [Aspergillus tanneri]